MQRRAQPALTLVKQPQSRDDQHGLPANYAYSITGTTRYNRCRTDACGPGTVKVKVRSCAHLVQRSVALRVVEVHIDV